MSTRVSVVCAIAARIYLSVINMDLVRLLFRRSRVCSAGLYKASVSLKVFQRLGVLPNQLVEPREIIVCVCKV